MENEKKLRKIDRFYWFVSRHNVVTLLFLLIVTGVFLFGAFQIRGEVILRDLLPYDHPYLKLHARFSEVFGSGASGVVIALRAEKGDIFNPNFLTKLQKMTDEVVLWEEVYRILTVSIASRSVKVVKTLKKGEISIEPLMWPEVPKDSEGMLELKKNIFSNPAYNGVLVSKDGRGALIFAEFKENLSYERVFRLLQKLRKGYTDEETSVHIVGFPMLMGWIYSLKPQMLTVFAISIAGMILVLYVIFSWNSLGVIVVMANVLILTVIGLGFIGFTGINFNPMLYVLAFLVGARMVSNSHQITYRYFEELHASGNNRRRACYETIRTMLFPNWAGVATDTAGFAVLGLAKIVLMQNLAIIMGFWITSIGLTAFSVPIICSLIPLKVPSENWAKEKSQIGWEARAISKMTRFCIGSPGRYVFSGLIIGLMVLFSLQISKLKIGDPTPGSPILWPNHTYNKDQQVINQLFDASSENFVLFYEGGKESVYDPAVLTTFGAFTRHMQESLPDIYKSSNSIINSVSTLNLTFHDGDKLWQELPGNENILSNLMGYLRVNTDHGTLSRYIDDGLERTQITLCFADHTSDNLLRIRDAAYDFFKNRPMKMEKGEFKLAGGRIGMEIALNEEMKRSHAVIDTTVLAGIFILITISFMSITGGLMVTLPLLFANSMAFAYMAFMGIGLSIDTLPVAAVGVGVGDDFCIYLYSRCQEEFPLQGGDWSQTIIQSVCTCGKAIFYSGITIVLPIITWYFFSDMKFQAQVGFFLAIIMGANTILALTLHALLIYIIKPKFISGKSKVLATEGKEIAV
jgi:hypothetical protein